LALAARGARNLDTGEEIIRDEAVRDTLRRQARAVHVKSALAAGVLTLLSLAISL
jgi:hypothetical protein